MADSINYSSVAGAMRLTGPVTSSATLITVDTVTGLPANVPFKLTIDGGLVQEELVKVTNVSGTNLTVVRGWDGTAAVAHANQASVRHMASAEDLRLSRQHEGATSGVHGTVSNVVGISDTQGLTNKSIDLGNNTVTGTKAQFQIAMTDDDFVTIAGAQTALDKTLSPSVAANVGAIVKGLASQAGDLQQWQNSAAAVLAKIDASGNITTPNITTVTNNTNTNTTNISNLTTTVNTNQTNARNVNDATYGQIPKSIAGSSVVTLTATGPATVSMPFGMTIAGAEKYSYIVQNADYGAQPDLVVTATSPAGAGSQTALTVRYTGGGAGNVRLAWHAIYRDV